MKDREATRAIRALAERQHGVFARWQLLELGLEKNLIQRRIEGGLLIPVFQGTFTLGHRRISRQGYWMAAVLASGPGAVLSHASAMELWGIRESTGPIEVLRRSGGVHRRRTGIRLHQTRRLPKEHVACEQGIPVTTIERAFLDMAARLSAKQLERDLVAAERIGRVQWLRLNGIVACGRGRKGAGKLRRVVAAVDPRAASTLSPLEVDFLALCREYGIPLPEVNVMVAGYLVDFVWPSERLVVETDGYTYHADRRAFESDHERTVALTAAGYEVHRATGLMLSRDPDTFMNLVRRSLRRPQPRTASNSLPAGRRI